MTPRRTVTVVPYDDQWPVAYADEEGRIRAALGERMLALHHIGSTAIVGLHAKPVIDMLLVVRVIASLDGSDPRIAMSALGYQAMGEFGIPGRRYFRKDSPEGTRTHHLHAFQQGDPAIDRHLAFRDYMNAHPAEAGRYADLKRRLAALHPGDIEAYVEGKAAFVQEHQAKAIEWRAARDHA